ncbi:MAG: efflux RND transporter periplasmic adaptor subunit [Pyrinomonadaceae bacterium]|nr:efflux RND transporter periplasmic adaptor subunit [Pyrinomonadaceae bacterium]
MKMKKMTALIMALAAVALVASGCGRSDEPSKQAGPTGEVRHVSIAKITRSSIEDYYESTGTVRAKTETQVSANMMGRIVSFPVSEGDTVSKGQLLVEIDDRESQAQFQKAQAAMREAQAGLVEIDRSVEAATAAVQTAEANRNLAQITFDRYKELFERRSATAQEFDEAQSRLKMARSELDRAKAGVQVIISKKRQLNARIDQAKAEIASTRVFQGYSRIASPVSGVVVKKFAEAGATAGPGAPLLSIEDNSQYRLEVGIDESRGKLVRIGNRVSVRIDAVSEGEFLGSVAEVMPTADAASRTYTVKIDIPANPILKSGLFGVAKFPVAQKDAITVPVSAIVERGQLSGVYIVAADGTAQFRIVTIGKTSEGKAEVLSGVAEGDEVVTSDTGAINDGTRVR